MNELFTPRCAMGGNALKKHGIQTRRVENGEFHASLCPDVLAGLTVALPGVRAEVIKSYSSKADFGDMDVLVDTQRLPGDWQERVLAHFAPNAHVSNGPVLSFDFRDFQVDLIGHSGPVYDFASCYYAFNDLGNLIGRIARRLGFKFGHDGLHYVLRDAENESRVIKTLLVTQDFDLALDFLGYESWLFHYGFTDLSDLFGYVASGKYFDANVFLLENRGHKARVRDRKRPTYMAFLKWVREQSLPEPVPVYKNTELGRSFDFFDGFRKRYADAFEQNRLALALKARFNGRIVAELTGLSGKGLGVAMARIKHSAGGEAGLQAMLLGIDEAQAREVVLGLANQCSLSP